MMKFESALIMRLSTYLSLNLFLLTNFIDICNTANEINLSAFISLIKQLNKTPEAIKVHIKKYIRQSIKT